MEITGLSTHRGPTGWAGEWIELDDDAGAGPEANPGASGRLHYAPYAHDGLRSRMATLATWIADARPDALVVDVSVEVALLARLHGVPVLTMAQPGRRQDTAHTLGYAISDQILAPWPAAATQIWHADSGAVAGKVHYLGAISRFPVVREPLAPTPGSVLVLNGAGGRQLTREVDLARAATPAWDWVHLGGPDGPWLDNPWPLLQTASVVVSHCGQSAVADISAARRPAVLIPQARPFREQATAAARAAPARGAGTGPGRLARPAGVAGAVRGGRGLGRPGLVRLERRQRRGTGGRGVRADGRGPQAGAGMRTALVTTVHGRHGHLRAQQRALTRLDPGPDLRVVVAMDDPGVAGVVAGGQATVVPVPRGQIGLPLAAGRNVGATTALSGGAELLVFLDVDCLPGPSLLHYYRCAARAAQQPALLCGPVAYLPPPPVGGYPPETWSDHPFHPGRPAPAPGEVQTGGDHRLFWSLSFAITAADWKRVGGFCELYQGYGAEDTDFAMLARQAGLGLTWVGGAAAYHQWHPTGSPPVEHLADILRNGALFARRWGWWPMGGWFGELSDLGLVRRAEHGGWEAADGLLAGAEPSGRSR